MSTVHPRDPATGLPLALLAALLLAAAGCHEDDDDSAGDGQDATGDDDDSGDDDDTTDPDGPPVDAVQWRLHEDHGTLVYVSWEQLEPATAHVEFRLDGEDWRSSPPAELAAGPAEALLLGIPYGTVFVFRVVNDLGEGPVATGEHAAETYPYPTDLPEPAVLQEDPTRWEPTGAYLLGSINQRDGGWTGGTYWLFIIDRLGRVVWAQATPDNHWTIYAHVSLDGDDLLWDESTYWLWDGGGGGKVHRSKIDGTVIETVATPGLHHAFCELPDGTIVWGAVDGYNERLDQRTPDGILSTVWDCEDYHALIGLEGQFCQSNSLWWHEASDSFLYSFFSTSSVIQVDRATGAILRIWGQVDGAWAFDPPTSGFWWQHGVTFTDAGTMLLSTHRTEVSAECLAREYTLDGQAEVLTEIWSYGAGEGINAHTAGEAHRLPSGNTLHNYGSGARLREVTPEGDVVWEVKWPGERLLGRTVFVEDLYAFAP